MKNQPVIMDTPTKLLACLSYFSILFMPVLFPLIAWLAATHIQQPNLAIAYHAKRAFWSQLLPTLLSIAVIVTIAGTGLAVGDQGFGQVAWLWLLLLGLLLFAGLLFWLYNIVMGIIVLLDR